MQKNITQDNYLRVMKADKDLAKDYYAKSVNKTEQQKALESLLVDSINKGELDGNAPYRIADLACGGGTLSYHLSSFFPNASFVQTSRETGKAFFRGKHKGEVFLS